MTLCIFVTALIGGFISRWFGGGFLDSPKFLKSLIWSIPFVLCCIFAVLPHTSFLDRVLIGTSILIYTMVFKNTGRGGGMDLGHSRKEPFIDRDPEKLEYLILWMQGRIPSYLYDFVLLTIIGLFSVAGAAFAIGWVNTPAGVIIALGGLGMPLGYMIGWYVFPTGQGDIEIDDIDEATEIGEFLSGFISYLCLAIAFFMVI